SRTTYAVVFDDALYLTAHVFHLHEQSAHAFLVHEPVRDRIFYNMLQDHRRYLGLLYVEAVIDVEKIRELSFQAQVLNLDIELQCIKLVFETDRSRFAVIENGAHEHGKFGEIGRRLILALADGKILDRIEAVE